MSKDRRDFDVTLEHRLTRLEWLVYLNIGLTTIWGGKDFILKLLGL